MTNPQQNALAEALEALKGCPFCGEPAEAFSDGDPSYPWCVRFHHAADCPALHTMDASRQGYASEQGAIAAWNRRASNNPAAVEGQGEARQEAIDLLVDFWHERHDKFLDEAASDVLGKIAALAPAPCQWQPIETAPKDGTSVLLCELEHPDIRPAMYHGVWSGDSDGSWMSLCGQYVTQSPEPTHWMPLPITPNPDREGV